MPCITFFICGFSFLKSRVFVPSYNRYAKSVGANHFHTSAKANKGLEEVFADLSQRMVDRRAEKSKANPAASATSAQRNKLVIVDDGRQSESTKKGCC